MSISTLLARNTMSSLSSHMDDHRAYHNHIGNHLARELKNLSFDMSWKNHRVNNDTRCYSPEENEHISSSSQNLNLLPDNLYDVDYSKSMHSIDSPLLDEEPYNTNPLNNAGCLRKSANMTETVPVPSSEHVAEIVGRQGCKIKSLRTQTNTYIKTPVRGAEPVFVVTGRKEDVAKAKQQILSAADHFSSIRAKRNGSAGSQGSSQTANSGTCSPTSNPGNLTILVKVPYKVVGLVVGPKGATIKRIQQITSTYIVTPGRDKEPVFEVTGSPEQVERAKEEIEKHIISRTAPDNNSDMQIDDFKVNGVDYGDQNTNSTSNNCSAKYNMINHLDSMSGPPSGTPHSLYHPIVPATTSIASHNHVNPQPIGSSGSAPIPSHHHLPLTSSMPISDYSLLPNYNNLHHNNFKSASPEFDHDEGIGTSGSTASVYDPSTFWGDVAYEVQRSNSVSLRHKDEMLPPGEDGPHPRTRRTNSDPISAAFQNIDATAFTSSDADEQRKSSILDRRHRLQNRAQIRTCMECERNVANAALVPCGHNTFCSNCASEICQRELERRLCPLCFQVPEQAIIIRN